MADQRPPSFFHILMNPSSPHLPLPLKFVTKHLRKEILEDPIVKSANGGYLWKLKMKKIDDQSYCLVDGWCNVVKDVGLLFGEFLLFRYVGSSVFIMHIYSVNGCENILVPKIKVADYGCIDDDDDVDDEVEVKEDVVYDDDHDDDVMDDMADDDDDVDDEMEEEEDVVYDDDDDVMDDMADDDEDEDDHHHVEDEDDVEFVDDGDEDDNDTEEDDDVLYDVNDDDVEDEDDGVDVDGDDGDPFFIFTSSKNNRNKLRFSPDFVALARIDTRESITLKNDDGCEKEMTVQCERKSKSLSYYVAAGWKEFQRSNGISEGDKCVFRFITSEDKICLAKITKKKTPTRPLPSAAKAPLMEVDADDVEDDDGMDDNDTEDDNDEDVELVNEEDPFFAVTITRAHNRVLRMPADFVRSARIDTKRTLTLRSLDGNEMAMPVQFDTQYGYHEKRYFLLKGWKDFMQDTNMSEGDKCVFKFITREDKLCLVKITKPPPAAEALATQVSDDDDKDDNENVEPFDDVDPFFVATITASYKSRLALPSDFVGLTGIDTKETITMISLDGNVCQMAVQKYKQKLWTGYRLSDGWHAFMQSNNISQGDECVFKYITSEDKMCLVKITKASSTEVDVDDRDPSFVVTITTAHKFLLRLPPEFVALSGIDTKENILMKSLDGNESEMVVRLDKRFNETQYNLSLGWVAFMQSNNISQGDVCIFKYITSEDKMCLVKINKASSTEVDDGMDVEDDNNKDEDENVKFADETSPFFVATIIPSQKSLLLLPTDFVALARIGTKENIVIKSLDGKEMQIALRSYRLKRSTRYCFSVGWTAFKRSNNICNGDQCVFKYIKSEDKMCLVKITKKITRETLVPTKVDNDDMDDEDVDGDGKGEDAKLVEDDNDNDTEEDDYDVDGDDGDPSFIRTISKASQYKLRFSSDFVALVKIDTRETITFKNDDGYEKEMPVQSDEKRNSTSYYVAAGWKEFQQSNDISEGDKCVFKFIPSEDRICVAKIIKKKHPARSYPPAAEARVTDADADDVEYDDGMDDKGEEDGNDKDEDEDLELVDAVDPFFVATITTGHKLYLPIGFVGLAGIVTKKNIIMMSLDGDEYQMVVRKENEKRKLATNYYLSKGWPAFMRSNNISQGDKCVFKYIAGEDKMCLAKITKAPVKEVYVDDEDPSFVVTITTTHKAMLRFWSDFVKLAGIDKKKTIVFKNLNGHEKEMVVQRDNQFKSSPSYFVASGFKEFLQVSDISEGDICVFKFIRCEDKICLAKITKKKTPATPLPPDIEPPVTEVDVAAGDDDDADDEDVERVDDGDPFFVATISHRFMPLPSDFVALAKIDTKENIIIKSLDGNERQMAIQSYKQHSLIRYHFSIGWPAFRRSNNISEGDECEFKYIRGEDKLCLVKVTKRKTGARSSPPAVVAPETEVEADDDDGIDGKDVEDDNDKDDDDEDVEIVADGNPFFVKTISPTNKRELHLPFDFARSVGIDTKETINLSGLDGYEKEMPVRYYISYGSKRYYVAKGWPEFKRINAISIGDKCVFKFITSDDRLCVSKINKKKTPTSPLPPAGPADDVECVDDGDPFFVVTISHKFMLWLPSDFVALAKIDTKENITIKSLDGNERPMAIRSYKQKHLIHYHFSIGWPSFRRSNNISKGDECVFKYIRSEDKMCLVKVTKRKTQARSSPPAAVATEKEVDDDDAEDDDGLGDKDTDDNNDKDEDEDADFDDDDDPFFVATITQHNFKGCLLHLPIEFVRSAGIDTKTTIVLKSLDGYEKEMPVRFETSYHYQAKHYFLRKWMDFARRNKISVGDKCVFKFITSEDKLCLAKITKAPPTEVDDDVEVDSGMDDNDADKDVECVDDVNDSDPFFVETITAIHKLMLRLPSAFVRFSGIDTKEKIIIKSLDGNERLMALRSYKQNKLEHYCLSIGWPAFMRSNSISEGDECVFKYITSEGKMCLAKVTKTKTQTRLSSPAKVVKKKRGRPAKVVKRKRGRPAKITMEENDKITVEEVLKRKRGRPPASPRATEDVKRKKEWEPRGDSADMEGVDKCVKVGKRPRGRPAKRLCGKAPQQT